MENGSRPVKLDRETLNVAAANIRNNFRNQAEYWEGRYQDMRDLLFEIIAHQAEVTCELRTDIELLETEVAKAKG